MLCLAIASGVRFGVILIPYLKQLTFPAARSIYINNNFNSFVLSKFSHNVCAFAQRNNILKNLNNQS
jgi:hypothetical protein